jgi:hypothetical protein
MTEAPVMNGPPVDLAEVRTGPQAELDQLRARLQISLGALELRLRELRSLQAWVRRHPWPFVVGAFAVGALLGLRRAARGPGVTGR